MKKSVINLTQSRKKRRTKGKYCAISNQKISAWRQSRKDRQGSLDE